MPEGQEIIPKGEKIGRPLTLTPEIGREINRRIAEGESLRTICSDDTMPSRSIVYDWLLRADEGEPFASFSDQYVRARELQADSFADEIQDIADDGANDWMETHDKDGKLIGWKVNGEAIQRSKLRVDARKWTASKLKPKKYGDRLDLTSGDKPIQHDLGDVAARAASLLTVARERMVKERDDGSDGE